MDENQKLLENPQQSHHKFLYIFLILVFVAILVGIMFFKGGARSDLAKEQVLDLTPEQEREVLLKIDKDSISLIVSNKELTNALQKVDTSTQSVE